MDSTTSLVVKVSYGGVLRRFRVLFKANGQLDLDMAGLRGKIAALFDLPVDDGFSLTYSDEDGDVVALVDDNDLSDVTNQRLKFLKIDVQQSKTNSIAPESLRGSSTASGMPDSQNPVSIIQKGINDVMMAVPNPMRDTISKVCIDLTSKAASSSPVVGELFDCISKLGKLSITQEGTPSSSVTKPGSSVPSPGEKKDVSKKSETGKKAANPNEPTGFTHSKTSGRVPTSWGVGASFNECPFAGGIVNGSSPNPMNLNKYPMGICQPKVFHKGIQCDGCGVVPITGTRFKSNVKENYDLCNICFSVMGKDGDYTRMEKPVSVQCPHRFRGQLTPISNPWLGPVPQPHHGGSNFRSTWPKLDSRFVLDVNVLDGTAVAPSAPFTKVWKMSNNGSLVWPRGTQIFWIDGDKFSNSLPYKQVDPATNKNAELAAISGRRSTQQTQGGADHQAKQRVNSGGNDGWRKTAVMSGSSAVTSPNSERSAEANVGDSLDTDSIGKPGSGISVEPNDNQRTTMRELARQRAQQRQKEEEERARDQRAKALAKLEELNRRSQLTEEGSVQNLEDAHNASTLDMPEVPRSHSPARMASKSDDVHTRISREKKTTVTAAESIEATEDSGKTLLQDAMPSAKYTNSEGSTQHDNFPRHRDGAASKQKRLGYKQKQNIVSEKKMAGTSFSEATTEVVDVVPPPEVSNEGVLGHNSDMPVASNVSCESTYTKRKNNRNGKKKHRGEETAIAMNPTRAAVGKDSKSGDESIEIGRERAEEIKFGSISDLSLDIKVSGNSSDQISSFPNEESQSRGKNNWKSQHLRRNPRSSVANKPGEKFPGSNTVIWAPVHPQQKADISTGVGTVPESDTSSKSLHQGQTNSKSKRVEMERYVAKPILKEMAEQVVSKNPITAAPEMTENCGGEGTGIIQPSGSTAGKSGSPSKLRDGNGRQGKHGRDHGSQHQRGSVASTKALEDGQFRETVNYHRSNQTEQISAGSSKDHTTCKADGWNDGWYMPPETHYSAAEEVEANGPGTVAVGIDQGMSFHGKQHASRNNKDGGSNYSDSKKANERDSSKAHTQQSGHGLGQTDLPVASKESRGPEDNVSHTPVTPNVNRGGNHGGREYARDKSYVSQKRDAAGYGHQRFTSEQKVTSADTPAQSQNRSISKEVQGEHNPNSMFQKNTGHSERFGRGHHDSQGGWSSSAQENMHHHHQRPPSNRDHRQKQNLHYEYKPVGSHTHDGQHSREQQFKDGSQAEGPPRYKEKGQGQQRHGGQKMYQPGPALG